MPGKKRNPRHLRLFSLTWGRLVSSRAFGCVTVASFGTFLQFPEIDCLTVALAAFRRENFPLFSSSFTPVAET